MPKSDDPYDPIRVRDKDTGYHLTIHRQNLGNGNYQELKQDAVNPLTGAWLEPDYTPADPSATKES